MKRVLIVAAHPDDEILGCGGMISKYVRLGVVFKIVFIGEGSTCRFQDPLCEAANQAIQKRNTSAIAALDLLQVKDVEFHNLPCGRFDQVPIISINKIIEAAIVSFSPDSVFTHSNCDANSDHNIVLNATIMATRPGAKNYVSKLMTYEVLSSSEWAFLKTFTPNSFEEITEEDLELKWQALALYETEVRDYPFPRSLEGIKALAMMRGMQSGCKYAEAFYLVRELR